MRWLFHGIAALSGILLAALIVFLVFGNASEQASQEGTAPETSASDTGASGCGSVEVPRLADRSTIASAGKHPPAILDARGTEVQPGPADQRRWFARIMAASGLCMDTIRVLPGTTIVELSTTDDVTGGEADAFTYGVLVVAFQRPLDRPLVRVTSAVGDEVRTAVVSRAVFSAFRAQRASAGLPASMAGLARFRRSTSFPSSEFTLRGWR